MKAKIKLILLIIISTLTFFIKDLVLVTSVFLAIIVVIFLLRIHSKLFEWIKPISIICVFIVILQTFTYPPIKFSVEGFFFGIIISQRLLVLFIAVFAFVSTTSPKQLFEAFDFLPYNLALMLTLAFRLLPLIKNEIIMIMNAQKARGLNFKSINVFKVYFPILVPLFGKTLEGSNRSALAMESRGFKGK
ncbi:MAG: energy-coupling factor transporter transmembrane component T [Candidatus Aenigmarchaeota archaeon]|nr:energy-coupling factor transporter transmembrane component T [Candidatus Aenigmarchaeota archaeon]